VIEEMPGLSAKRPFAAMIAVICDKGHAQRNGDPGYCRIWSPSDSRRLLVSFSFARFVLGITFSCLFRPINSSTGAVCNGVSLSGVPLLL
jgi:hypothetical protein